MYEQRIYIRTLQTHTYTHIPSCADPHKTRRAGLAQTRTNIYKCHTIVLHRCAMWNHFQHKRTPAEPSKRARVGCVDAARRKKPIPCYVVCALLLLYPTHPLLLNPNSVHAPPPPALPHPLCFLNDPLRMCVWWRLLLLLLFGSHSFGVRLGCARCGRRVVVRRQQNRPDSGWQFRLFCRTGLWHTAHTTREGAPRKRKQRGRGNVRLDFAQNLPSLEISLVRFGVCVCMRP